MEELLKVLQILKIKTLENVETSKLSTYKGGGIADYVVFPNSIMQCCLLTKVIKDYDLKYKIIGGFSNILVRDKGYSGLMISTQNFRGIKEKDSTLSVGSGQTLAATIKYARDKWLGGLENFVGIPCMIGGAVHNNIGAFGEEFSNLVDNIMIYDIEAGRVKDKASLDMQFGYHKSNVSASEIIIECDLNLQYKEKQNIDLAIREIRAKRLATQPIAPSLGSVFKRCSNTSAGFYIDQAGLKGLRCNGAEISSKHANFIVNRGGGTASDFLHLAEIAKTKVFKEFGIILEEEIEVI